MANPKAGDSPKRRHWKQNHGPAGRVQKTPGRGQMSRARTPEQKLADLTTTRAPIPDPITGRDDEGYSDEEFAFLRAVEAYQKRYDKKWLRACDYLLIAKALGYSKT